MPRLNDPYAKLLNIELSRVEGDGVVTTAKIEKKHLNPYRIAHGGFAYTMGCVTAQMAAALCLGRNMEVSVVTSQYLRSLVPGLATCQSSLLYESEHLCTYDVKVWDAAGELCFSQLVTLRPERARGEGKTEFPRTIIPAEPDPEGGRRLPSLAPGAFCEISQIYVLDVQDGPPPSVCMGTDILPDTCDGSGAAHCGLIYTCCDTCVGGSARQFGKASVTVSSVMTYFDAAVTGPVKVRAKCVRNGNSILYFQVSATDGMGKQVAAGQFCMHPKPGLMKILEEELKIKN